MRPLRIFGIAIVFAALFAFGLRADEIEGAKIFKADKGRLAFEHEGKKRVLAFGLGLKYFDKEGAELDLLKGSGILAPGNIVNLTTEKDDTSPEPTIRAIRLVEGTIVEMKPMKEVDLLPDPNYTGSIMDSNWPTDWFPYYGTAKKGDFAEISGFGRARREVLEATADSVLVAHVVDTKGSRTEFRVRYTMSEARKSQYVKWRETNAKLAKAKEMEENAKVAESKSSTKKAVAGKSSTNKSTSKNSKNSKNSKTTKSTAAKNKEKETAKAKEAEKPEKKEPPTTETITVGDVELECKIVRLSESAARWISDKVPFEGYVRVRISHGDEDLVAFGRGE